MSLSTHQVGEIRFSWKNSKVSIVNSMWGSYFHVHFSQAFLLAPSFLEGILDLPCYHIIQGTEDRVPWDFRVLALAEPWDRKAILPALSTVKQQVSEGSEAKKGVGPGTRLWGWGSCRSPLCSSISGDSTGALPPMMRHIKGLLANTYTLLCLSLAFGEEGRDTLFTISKRQQGQGWRRL